MLAGYAAEAHRSATLAPKVLPKGVAIPPPPEVREWAKALVEASEQLKRDERAEADRQLQFQLQAVWSRLPRDSQACLRRAQHLIAQDEDGDAVLEYAKAVEAALWSWARGTNLEVVVRKGLGLTAGNPSFAAMARRNLSKAEATQLVDDLHALARGRLAKAHAGYDGLTIKARWLQERLLGLADGPSTLDLLLRTLKPARG